MTTDNANTNDQNQLTPAETVLDETLKDLEAEAAADKVISPVSAGLVTDKIKVKSRKDPGEDIHVTIEQTKRRKLNEILELLRDFTPKEVKQIVKVDKRRRKVERIEAKNTQTLTGILGK